MSASEKMKALAEKSEKDSYLGAQQAAWALQAALPHIVAVVEAAERAQIDGVVTDDGIFVRPKESMGVLWDALDALEEALK